jgi:NAD(P)-dependent dehydrogenase (short-subunit alcohol dehydrogenase family)
MPIYDDFIKRIPAGRFGTPEECAGTAIYLASNASDFVTGTTVYLHARCKAIENRKAQS